MNNFKNTVDLKQFNVLTRFIQYVYFYVSEKRVKALNAIELQIETDGKVLIVEIVSLK